jgi:hypothetical protein
MQPMTVFSKNYWPVVALMCLLLNACVYMNRQDGSGNVIKTEHPVAGYNKLDISIVLNAVIIPSSTDKVVVELDDNLQQYVEINQSDSTLHIQMKKEVHFGRHADGKVYIFTKSLHNLNNSSVGNLTNEAMLTADNFVLTNSAIGYNDLKIKARNITINNSAVGKTDLYLQSEKLSLTNSAVGKTLLTGNCTNAVIENSSVGNFDAKNLTVQTLHINNSAVGSADVMADKEFYIENSGVGKLDIYGNGVIKKLDDSGISKIHKH